MQAGTWGKRIAIAAAVAVMSMAKAGSSRADDYHTPLAGAEYRTQVAGKPVIVPAYGMTVLFFSFPTMLINATISTDCHIT